MSHKTKAARHAEEPWSLSGEGRSGQILSAKGGVVGNFGLGGIDARRAVACVNACAGIPTEALERGDLGEALMVGKMISAGYLGTDGTRLPSADEANRITLHRLLRALGRLP